MVGGRGAYTTVSTVCSAALLRCLVYLNVLNDQVAGVETLRIRVCLGVLQQAQEKFSGLDRPSCAGDTELLSCNIIPSASTHSHSMFQFY
jgi:hypothetical protein